MTQRMHRPKTKRKSSIHKGDKSTKSTFVETKVKPHTKMVKSATRWYFIFDLRSSYASRRTRRACIQCAS